MLTLALVLALAAPPPSTGKLHGRVTDSSGAVMTGATVVVTSATSGAIVETDTDRAGKYTVDRLPPGDYVVLVTAAGFTDTHVAAAVAAGGDRTVDIVMTIAVQRQEIVVHAEPAGGVTDPSANANATVLKGKDLDALSDDPDELEAQLHAIAGPGAGGRSGQVYVDGFTGGRLPPKSAIQEIRINLNPYSAEFDSLGTGRIEIITKPGSQTAHGRFVLDGNTAALNSRNPFLPTKPDHHYTLALGTVSGPIASRASFVATGQFEERRDTSAINATVLDASLDPTPLRASVASPRRLVEFNPRLDVQPTQAQTLVVRYAFTGDDEQGTGVGQLSLASQAMDLRKTDHDVQITSLQILGPTLLNETRFQYRRSSVTQTAQSLAPQVTVLGAFMGGGSALGGVQTVQQHVEIHDYVSRTLATHSIRAGGRVRIDWTSDSSARDFNGTFTFPSLAAFQTTEQGLQLGWTAAQIRAAGGGASQFSIAAGQPAALDTMADAGLFVQDDWRLRANVTVSAGLRVETQTDIAVRPDVAPRIGIAWNLGRAKKGSASPWVIRAGAGLFFDRFPQTLALQAAHLDGTRTQQFVVAAPDFFPQVPSIPALTAAAVAPTVYRIDPSLRVPRTLQSGATLERKLPKASTISIGYLHSIGSHQLLSRNVNAPASEASTLLAPLYEFDAIGRFAEHQMTTNFTLRPAGWLSLSGFYVLTSARGNTSGPTAFASNAFDLTADEGRMTFDVRHRFTLFAGMDLPGFRIVPFVTASSGQPFDVTVGQDLNRDSVFNDRPAFATDLSRRSVVATPFGAFDTAPLPGAVIIPRNFGDGPAQVSVNLRVMKPFVVHQHDTIRFDMVVSNLFNRVNAGAPVGNLSSPLFGQSIGLSNPLAAGANRQLHVQLQFLF